MANNSERLKHTISAVPATNHPSVKLNWPPILTFNSLGSDEQCDPVRAKQEGNTYKLT